MENYFSFGFRCENVQLFGNLIHVFHRVDRGNGLEQMWRISYARFDLKVHERHKNHKLDLI